MKTKFSAIIVALGILTVHHAFAIDVGPVYRGINAEASGMTGVASAKHEQALYFNPAMLAGDSDLVRGGVVFTQGLNSVLFEYADWAVENKDFLSKPDSLISRIDPIDNLSAPFANTLGAWFQYKDIAFSVLNDSRYNLAVTKVMTPFFRVGVISDLVITAGRGMIINEEYNLGLALKYVYRIRYKDQYLGTLNSDFYTVKNKLEESTTGIFGKISKIQAAAEVAETQQGIGLNAGFTRKLTNEWTGGLSLLDFPTVLDSKFLRPNFLVGLGYHRPLGIKGPDLKHEFLFNAEMHNFLMDEWYHQLKLGVALTGEARGRELYRLSFGLNDGYPTLGIKMGYIGYLSYVYTGEEAGAEPGQDHLSFHKVSFEIAF